MEARRNVIALFLIGLALLGPIPVRACLWDAVTLFEEEHRDKSLASAILNEAPPPVDVKTLEKTLSELRAHPRENEADWWNNVAGTLMRLGRPAEAAQSLEGVVSRFRDNYGIHANLGTAYHLLGRYGEAEREIRRDLEINPEAHFGLEKFHLALLQYLSKPKDYQARHLYVDEWSLPFHAKELNRLTLQHPHIDLWRLEDEELHSEATNHASSLTLEANATGLSQPDEWTRAYATDKPPEYRARWNLLTDPKLEEGVALMASLNPREPACFVVAGLVALKNHNYHLEIAAFQRAIALDTPQRDVLEPMIKEARKTITGSEEEGSQQFRNLLLLGCLVLLIPAAIAYFMIQKIRTRRRARAAVLS